MAWHLLIPKVWIPDACVLLASIAFIAATVVFEGRRAFLSRLGTPISQTQTFFGRAIFVLFAVLSLLCATVVCLYRVSCITSVYYMSYYSSCADCESVQALVVAISDVCYPVIVPPLACLLCSIVVLAADVIAQSNKGAGV